MKVLAYEDMKKKRAMATKANVRRSQPGIEDRRRSPLGPAAPWWTCAPIGVGEAPQKGMGGLINHWSANLSWSCAMLEAQGMSPKFPEPQPQTHSSNPAVLLFSEEFGFLGRRGVKGGWDWMLVLRMFQTGIERNTNCLGGSRISHLMSKHPDTTSRL